MAKNVKRRIEEPLRKELSYEEAWEGPDNGLIKCWEVGRARAEKSPALSDQCRQGELPVLGWKGGVSRTLVKLEKFGALNYLAQWQGLRGEDLDIDTTQETTLTCTKTGMIVIFTPDQSKYINQI